MICQWVYNIRSIWFCIKLILPCFGILFYPNSYIVNFLKYFQKIWLKHFKLNKFVFATLFKKIQKTEVFHSKFCKAECSLWKKVNDSKCILRWYSYMTVQICLDIEQKGLVLTCKNIKCTK